MAGIRCVLEVFHMARGARRVRGGEIVIVVRMAGSARHAQVRAGQRKSSCAVVEVGLQPRVHSVTSLATCGKTGRHVVRRQGILEIPYVTRITVRR